MSIVNVSFEPFERRMRAEALPEITIQTFKHYYQQLIDGNSGLISEDEIRPVQTLPDADDISDAVQKIGESVLPRTIVLKLNGGLGTGMGLAKAKSLLTIKDGMSFLDIIAKQAIHSQIPLVLMNSFSTQADSLAALAKYPDLKRDLPLDFLQNKVPKIRQDTLQPAEYTDNPELAWNPPGHGDIYTALITSGMLDKLLAGGYEYAFVSNADNLGAVMNTRILGYFASGNLPFMMEVADRTPADRKGGHLALQQDGQLTLRESAQCPPEDVDNFQNIQRHKYFNTNNLWLHLPTLKSTLEQRNNVLGLPMIRNKKPVNPRKPDSEPIYQIETAMGSAISIFPGAAAIRVSRERFAPVKKTSDLLAVRSDAYIITDDFRVIINPERERTPVVVTLDERYYKLIDDLETRFPFGPPSLLNCASLSIKGDYRFGRNVTVSGNVSLPNGVPEPQHVGDDVRLYG